MRVLILLLAALGLAACEAQDFASAFDGAGGQGVSQVPLFRGDVRVAGPEGYCIDRKASQLPTGFVVMAACPVISRSTAVPEVLGLITIQVGAEGSAAVAGSEETLSALLETDAGAALLVSGEGSRRGDVAVGDNLVLAYVEESAGSALGAVEPGRWRGFTDVAGRLVSVTAYGLTEAPASESRKLRLARSAVAALAAVNPTDAAETTPEA